MSPLPLDSIVIGERDRSEDDMALVMTEPEARRVTERIRLTATNVRDNLTRLRDLVDEAQRGQAHVALGYSSWTAYLAEVFGDEPLRLPRDERQALVGYLAGEGMSTRAIAPIVGASQMTVVRDLAAGESSVSPGPSADRPSPMVDYYPSHVIPGGEVTPGGQVEPVPPAPGSVAAPARPDMEDLAEAAREFVGAWDAWRADMDARRHQAADQISDVVLDRLDALRRVIT